MRERVLRCDLSSPLHEYVSLCLFLVPFIFHISPTRTDSYVRALLPPLSLPSAAKWSRAADAGWRLSAATTIQNHQLTNEDDVITTLVKYLLVVPEDDIAGPT